jgi:hypothetical protein
MLFQCAVCTLSHTHLHNQSLAADGSHVRMGTALSERINHKMAKGAARAFQASVAALRLLGVFAVIALPCEPTQSRGVRGCDDTVAHDCDEQAISKAHNVNICFVMDTTGSMHSHMVAVKAQIHSIVEGVKRMGCRIAGLAFVSYKDWCDGADRVQVSGSVGHNLLVVIGI